MTASSLQHNMMRFQGDTAADLGANDVETDHRAPRASTTRSGMGPSIGPIKDTPILVWSLSDGLPRRVDERGNVRVWGSALPEARLLHYGVGAVAKPA